MKTVILMAMLAGDSAYLAPKGELVKLDEGASITLDSEPLASGDCEEDKELYRQALRKMNRNWQEADGRPSWALTIGLLGLGFLLGVGIGTWELKSRS